MSDSKKLQDLNKLYQDADQADKEIYAEMRSNVLLIAGEHYAKKNWKHISALRDSTAVTQEQKIRITKNHVNRIFKTYVNNIVTMAPGTTILPQNEKELQDQKSAELHNSVWQDIKKRHNFGEIVHNAASDYVALGEVFYKIYWDWNKGRLKGKKPQIETDDMGEQKVVGEEYIWSGDLVFERIFAFNIFRPSTCQEFSKAEWVGIRKMVNKEELIKKYGSEEATKKALETDAETSYMVFDSNKAGYQEKKDEILVKEVYYRPSEEYPKGYYYVFTKSALLDEGEIPFGVFPIISAGFDEIPTHPRFRSFIRQIKPYQVELNRVASKMAEHQITLGDDKLVMSNGGKMSAAGEMPGIRAYSVTGSTPVVIPGRTGEQYVGYMSNTITEMYQVAMIQEELEEKMSGQIDPYALLMQSARWKKRFSLHIQRFERFLVEMCKLALETTRNYIEEDELIQKIGRHEAVNITEFKNTKDIGYEISIESQSEDIESRIGKKMALDRYLQYAGTNLSKEDIGKFLRMDPYLNKEQIFSDFTLAYDNATNDILALDRGEMPPIFKYRYPDVNYIVQKLSHRMGQSDFNQLPPQVQQAYEQVLMQYEQIIQQNIQDQAALNSEFIPADGPLIRCDLWIEDPKDPSKQARFSVPTSSLLWLKERLDAQGFTSERLAQQQQAIVSDIVGQMRNQAAAQAQQQQAQLPPGGAELAARLRPQ